MASNSKFLAELLDSNGDVNTANLDNLSSTLGTASTNDTGDFLQVSNNLSDLNDAGTALDNLGFSTFGKSIIDDADAAAVRTTLGLGEAATSDTLGGSFDFTATGALANGDIVGLRSDGTVEKIYGEVYSSTPLSFTNGGYDIRDTQAIFDSNSNKVVIIYTDGGGWPLDGRAVVGTVSGNSITFGAPVIYESTLEPGESPIYGVMTHDIAFDSNSNKVVIAFMWEASVFTYYGYAIVGTVSGDTITFGTRVIFNMSITHNIKTVFDPVNNKVVIAYRNQSDSNYGYAIVGTVSGDTISFGTPVVFNSAWTGITEMLFDPNSNKVAISYNNTVVLGTVSGDTISFGTPFSIPSGGKIVIDTNSNKWVIAYTDTANANYGTAVVGTVSGDTITFGTPVVFDSTNTAGIILTFDSNSNKVVIAYMDVGNASRGTVCTGTVSGDTISFTYNGVFEDGRSERMDVVFDPVNNKAVIAYMDYYDGQLGKGVVFDTNATITNADTWIGIADGTSGAVKLMGGVAEGLTGLTTGTIYYVNYDGTLTSTQNAVSINGTYGKIGKALSSTQLLITEGNA